LRMRLRRRGRDRRGSGRLAAEEEDSAACVHTWVRS
jgi:hypothetical protein